MKNLKYVIVFLLMFVCFINNVNATTACSNGSGGTISNCIVLCDYGDVQIQYRSDSTTANFTINGVDGNGFYRGASDLSTLFAYDEIFLNGYTVNANNFQCPSYAFQDVAVGFSYDEICFSSTSSSCGSLFNITISFKDKNALSLNYSYVSYEYLMSYSILSDYVNEVYQEYLSAVESVLSLDNPSLYISDRFSLSTGFDFGDLNLDTNEGVVAALTRAYEVNILDYVFKKFHDDNGWGSVVDHPLISCNGDDGTSYCSAYQFIIDNTGDIFLEYWAEENYASNDGGSVTGGSGLSDLVEDEGLDLNIDDFVDELATSVFDFQESYISYVSYFTLDIDETVDDLICEGEGGLLGSPTDPNDTAYYLQTALDIMKYIAIVALISLSSIDFIKAVASSDSDALKKAGKTAAKRLMYTVILFLFPIILKFIFELIGIYGSGDPFCGLDV